MDVVKSQSDVDSAPEVLLEMGAFERKDEVGRNALLTASMLGRSATVREMVNHGAQVNDQTVRGYSALHLAACWGHLETVRTLLELGADTHARTFKGERPVNIAKKYSRTACVDCLILGEAKQDLKSFIAYIKDKSSDPEKNLTREEKNICARECNAKSDWMQTVANASVSDYIAQKRDMEYTLHIIISKMSSPEPPDKP